MRKPDSGPRRQSYLHYWEKHNPMPEASQLAALIAPQVATANALLRRGLERIARGSSIANPTNPAAEPGVSLQLSSAAIQQGSLGHSIGNAVSLLQTQNAALKVSGKILERIKELRTLNETATKSPSDKANYNAEFLELKNQLIEITSAAFNGVPLFGRTSFTITTSEDAATSSPVTIAARDLSSKSAGVGTITAANSLGEISTESQVTLAIKNVGAMRGGNEVEQTSLGVASERLTLNQTNLEAASSRIPNVGVARESTLLATKSTLAAAGSSVLLHDLQSSQTSCLLLQ